VKFLLDENLSPNQAQNLRDLGYDAVAVVELGLEGSPDERVRMAAIETGRVLITLDADFANILRFSPLGTPGVLRLRVHPPKEQAVRELLAKALHMLREQDLRDCMAVAHRDLIRIRNLSKPNT